MIRDYRASMDDSILLIDAHLPEQVPETLLKLTESKPYGRVHTQWYHI